MHKHPEPSMGTEDKVTFHRILAYLVDNVIVFGLFGLGYILAFFVGGMSPTSTTDPTEMFMAASGFMAIIGLVTLLLFVVYKPLFETWLGYTPGKGVFGLVVVKTDGSNCTLGAAVIRHVLRIFDILFLYPPYAIGLFSMGVTERKQRLGDLAAGTVVVKQA